MTMRLGHRSYDIIVKRGCLKNLYQFTETARRRVFILTDSGVPAQYAQTVLAQCPQGTVYTVPQGEGSKCLKTYGEVLAAMLAAGLTRRDLLVAVGGGVVGDLGGFCAATYMRGIDFINCPTTTLAQVDSSIGGKTAIDLGPTKNIVGAFWEPRLVLVDPDTLATLPPRQVSNGLAEALKTALIGDARLFALFEGPDPTQSIEEIICRSLRFKKQIVENDEREQGQRACLNFGHTIGHGIEAVRGVGVRRRTGLYHGECVAIGMLPMIEDKALQKRARAVCRRLGLPTALRGDKQKILAQMLHDKKSRGQTVTVIRVPGLGCWRADTLPVEELGTLLGLEGPHTGANTKEGSK